MNNNEPTVVNIKMVNGERPDYDIYIGRQLNYPQAKFPLSKWHNPFSQKTYPLINILDLFEVYMKGVMYRVWPIEDNDKFFGRDHDFWMAYDTNLVNAVRRSLKRWKTWDLSDLTGKVLGCWCKPAPCHGDILVKLWREYCNE